MVTRLELHEDFSSDEHDKVTVSVDNDLVRIIVEVADITKPPESNKTRSLGRLVLSHGDFDTIAKIVGRYRNAAPHAGADIEGTGQ